MSAPPFTSAAIWAPPWNLSEHARMPMVPGDKSPRQHNGRTLTTGINQRKAAVFVLNFDMAAIKEITGDYTGDLRLQLFDLRATRDSRATK